MNKIILLMLALCVTGCGHEVSSYQLKTLLPTCDDRGGIYSITTHPNKKIYTVRCADDKEITVNFESRNQQ